MNTLQPRSAVERFLVVAAAIAVIAFGMRWGADLILPFVIILYTTALVTPLYEWMVRKGLPKWLAILALILLLIGVFAGVFWLVIHSFRQMFAGLGETEAQMGDRLQALGGSVGNFVSLTGVEEQISQASNQLGGFLAGVLSHTAQLFATGFVVLIGVVLILLDSANLRTQISELLNRGGPHLAGVRRLPGSLVQYFVARTQINLFTGTAVTIFLLIMRIDYAPLWGVLAFFLSYIPYIGLTLAAIPAVVLAFATHGLVSAIIVIIGYVVLNQVAEAILEPKITGARLSLKPWFVFLAMFAFGWLMGPAGVFLAGPLTILLVVFLSMFDSTHWMLNLALAAKPESTAGNEATAGESTA